MTAMDGRGKITKPSEDSGKSTTINNLIEIVAQGEAPGNDMLEVGYACNGLANVAGIDALGQAFDACNDLKRRAALFEGLVLITEMHHDGVSELGIDEIAGLRKYLGPLFLEGRANGLPIQILNDLERVKACLFTG